MRWKCMAGNCGGFAMSSSALAMTSVEQQRRSVVWKFNGDAQHCIGKASQRRAWTSNGKAIRRPVSPRRGEAQPSIDTQGQREALHWQWSELLGYGTAEIGHAPPRSGNEPLCIGTEMIGDVPLRRGKVMAKQRGEVRGKGVEKSSIVRRRRGKLR